MNPKDETVDGLTSVIFSTQARVYFTYPYDQDFPAKEGVTPLTARGCSLQTAELEVQAGRLTWYQNRAFCYSCCPPPNSPRQ